MKLHILEPNGTFIVAAVITAFGFSNGVSVCAVPGATIKEYLNSKMERFEWTGQSPLQSLITIGGVTGGYSYGNAAAVANERSRFVRHCREVEPLLDIFIFVSYHIPERMESQMQQRHWLKLVILSSMVLPTELSGVFNCVYINLLRRI